MFRDAGVEGAFVLRDLGDDSTLVHDPDLADRPCLPASTFKMANTLIGLETAVIPDAGFTLPWDGVDRDFVPAWNADHDLDSAMEHSVLWYFQEIARRVGEERYRDWLARLDYGNHSGGVDRFWVAGDLRISPRQQADFVARLVRGQLPVSARSVGILRDVMPRAESEGVALRAKTGLTEQDTERVGWLVGWIERDGQATHTFAGLVLGPAGGGWRDSPVFAARREVPLELLRRAGVVPAAMPPPR